MTRDLFGHPRGLGTLFFTELWERFSHYGMRALLILFMTAPREQGGMGLDVASAGAIYGLYTGCVYLACLPGGWLADRLLGQRRATFVGGAIILCGHICLAVPAGDGFYLGLILLVVGTGLLKPNVSTLVGALYADADARRDAGYSIYYMGINSGALLAPLVCGWLAQSAAFRNRLLEFGIDPILAWHFGFGAAALGMAAGLMHYALGYRHLAVAAERETAVRDARQRLRAWHQLGWASVVVAAVAAVLGSVFHAGGLRIEATLLGNVFGILLAAITIAFFVWLFLANRWTDEERRRLYLVLALFLGASAFWSLYEQGGSTLNLFAARSTDTRLFGHAFPSTWLLSLNPILIVFGMAPAFAWLWMRLGSRAPSAPAKFTLGLACMALGYAIMIGAGLRAAPGELVSPLWLVAMYVVHTMGEMCLSPVGLSAMSRLAPARIAGLTMGVWFLASSVGSYLGGRVAGFYETFSSAEIFTALTLFGVIATCAMAALVRPLNRLLVSA